LNRQLFPSDAQIKRDIKTHILQNLSAMTRAARENGIQIAMLGK
jgi:hypothetical protein